ncbi:MAG: hypothetical protein Kilf2KO_06340 [Rhodospirillales bacterium]
MRILHLSADYPDPLVPAKTKAIFNLLSLAKRQTHSVISLNRVSWRLRIASLAFADATGEDHRAVAYGAPPKGLLMKRYLDRLADYLTEDLQARGLVPDLIHAHKLSVEGLVADRLARGFGCPLAISLQGDSDLKIVSHKRALRADYRRIWQEAALVFPFAPWTAARMTALLGTRHGPSPLLPCPGPAASGLAPRTTPQATPPIVRCAFHLGVADRKNAKGLILGLAKAARQIPEIRLEILGGGDAGAFAELRRFAEAEAPGRVAFLGAVPHEAVQGLFNSACAFALVSHRESYGMVFAEALLAGCPCLIPRGWGIDGYFEEGSVVLSADAKDPESIAAGLVRLVQEEAAFKARLAALAEGGGLDKLCGAAILETYEGALASLATGDREGSA